jgi:hypothetical protein
MDYSLLGLFFLICKIQMTTWQVVKMATTHLSLTNATTAHTLMNQSTNLKHALKVLIISNFYWRL